MRAPWQRTATTEQRSGLTPTELLVVVLVLLVALAIAVPVMVGH
jgi:Tfp pilus assembly protein FimT